jgi:preprotein translocase SecE subunit
MAKTNPAEFIQEVRDESKKVTWPSRKETMITTGMVLLMVFGRLAVLPVRRPDDFRSFCG